MQSTLQVHASVRKDILWPGIPRIKNQYILSLFKTRPQSAEGVSQLLAARLYSSTSGIATNYILASDRAKNLHFIQQGALVLTLPAVTCIKAVSFFLFFQRYFYCIFVLSLYIQFLHYYCTLSFLKTLPILLNFFFCGYLN